MNLHTVEREKYDAIWSIDGYAAMSPGEKYIPLFLELAKARTGWHTGSVLDAGTGSGKAAVALASAGFCVTCCDLTPSGLIDEARDLPFFAQCLWKPFDRPQFFDWVYCCDVLEHIPPAFTMLVISHLLKAAKKGLFLSIGMTPDHFGVWVGEPLHVTVQPFTWWRDHLSQLGTVVAARDLLNAGVFYVEPFPC